MEDLSVRPPRKDLLQDFAIFDEGEVVVEESKSSTHTFRIPSEQVQVYLEIFEEQKKFARKLDDISAESGWDKNE